MLKLLSMNMITNKQTCHYSETETFDATLPILFLTQTNYSMLWYDKTSYAYFLMFYRYFQYNAKMSIKLNAVKQFVIKIFPILLLPQII